MWNGRVTDELISLSKKYGDKFNMSPECYENVECNDFTYEELCALIRLSIEKDTELPETIHNVLGYPEFIENK